jgi:DnaJ-domain-containing protein 1
MATNETKDFYKILGLGDKRDATPEEIKKAYQKMAGLYHPGMIADQTTEDAIKKAEKFREIQDAYNVLSDPDKRARYNAQSTGTSYVPPKPEPRKSSKKYEGNFTDAELWTIASAVSSLHLKICTFGSTGTEWTYDTAASNAISWREAYEALREVADANTISLEALTKNGLNLIGFQKLTIHKTAEIIEFGGTGSNTNLSDLRDFYRDETRGTSLSPQKPSEYTEPELRAVAGALAKIYDDSYRQVAPRSFNTMTEERFYDALLLVVSGDTILLSDIRSTNGNSLFPDVAICKTNTSIQFYGTNPICYQLQGALASEQATQRIRTSFTDQELVTLAGAMAKVDSEITNRGLARYMDWSRAAQHCVTTEEALTGLRQADRGGSIDLGSVPINGKTHHKFANTAVTRNEDGHVLFEGNNEVTALLRTIFNQNFPPRTVMQGTTTEPLRDPTLTLEAGGKA